MTTWRCGRCHQVLVPGQRPPLCLGGDYRCDVTWAVAELQDSSKLLQNLEPHELPSRSMAIEQPTRLRVHDLPRDVVRGLAGVLGVVQHGRTLEQLRGDVEAALTVTPVADAA